MAHLCSTAAHPLQPTTTAKVRGEEQLTKLEESAALRTALEVAKATGDAAALEKAVEDARGAKERAERRADDACVGHVAREEARGGRKREGAREDE